MKQLLLIAMLIIAAAVTATPATAGAASCSPSGVGDEKTPGTTTTTVTETGAQGYKCTTSWDADVQPQYESGGTWHYCVECAPAFHPDTPDQFWPPNIVYNWSDVINVYGDEDQSWTPTIAEDTPPCSVNWRLQVNFFNQNHNVFQSDTSPTLHKTC